MGELYSQIASRSRPAEDRITSPLAHVVPPQHRKLRRPAPDRGLGGGGRAAASAPVHGRAAGRGHRGRARPVAARGRSDEGPRVPAVPAPLGLRGGVHDPLEGAPEGHGPAGRDGHARRPSLDLRGLPPLRPGPRVGLAGGPHVQHPDLGDRPGGGDRDAQGGEGRREVQAADRGGEPLQRRHRRRPLRGRAHRRTGPRRPRIRGSDVPEDRTRRAGLRRLGRGLRNMAHGQDRRSPGRDHLHGVRRLRRVPARRALPLLGGALDRRRGDHAREPRDAQAPRSARGATTRRASGPSPRSWSTRWCSC